MNIPFKVKLLTETAKAPEQANEGDLWDIFADDFAFFVENTKEPRLIHNETKSDFAILEPRGRILIKTGIAIELPIYRSCGDNTYLWSFTKPKSFYDIASYAVADIRPRSGLALKHGITVLNTPATIDNSYRKEIGVILINHGHEPFCLTKGMKIAQMLIRPLYPSSFEIVKDFEDTGRGGYGSTGN